MGNDQSHMSKMQVEEKAVEVTDFWTHHTATINSGNTTVVSVFIGEPLIGGSLWVSQTPLEKSSKNLMIHRHPCILKYISSWSKGSKFYLAVENVKPLSHMLSAQSTLQICVGLHSILKALVFLHDKALASHNNVCTASIYVTKDGAWKLGGLEYLCKFKDMNVEYTSRSKSHRYTKAIDPNEDKNVEDPCGRKDSIDIYAFAILVNEVFKIKSDDVVPSLEKFIDMCKNDLQNVIISERPKLYTLLDHDFFNHEFIYIHSFLTELPLKSDSEKNDFFSTLIEKLKTFDEVTVAGQLGALLLSRMVLLNKSAQTKVIPFILIPKEAADSNSLFSIDTFKKFIVPKLLEIFCVRDAQIRLLLLEYLTNFINCFSKVELQSQILPELLVGIKDTNDHLVAVTLRSLSDLIPILGSATVIGGKRAKLFNDGRPIIHQNKPRSRRNSKRTQELLPTETMPIITLDNDILSNSATEISDLPERPSPDGEEGETSTDEIEITAEEEGEVDEENWDDWEINEENVQVEPSGTLVEAALTDLSNSQIKKAMPDILELDIKNQRNLTDKFEEFDFFQDMEPVIEASSKFLIENTNVSKLDLVVNSMDHPAEGWGEEDWDE